MEAEDVMFFVLGSLMLFFVGMTLYSIYLSGFSPARNVQLYKMIDGHSYYVTYTAQHQTGLIIEATNVIFWEVNLDTGAKTLVTNQTLKNLILNESR